MPTGCEPTDAVTLAKLVRDYGPAVPWALVAWGWFLSNKHANHRELRKETRSELDRLLSSIRELADYNRAYGIAEPGSTDEVSTALAIKVGFNRVSASLERLLARLDDPASEVEKRFTKFYENVTGGDFESSSRQIRPANNPSFIATSAIAEKLIDAIEKAYLRRFS